MNSKQEVKTLLKESGNSDLWSDDVYIQVKQLTAQAAKRSPNLGEFFNILEGAKEKYMHDLIVINRQSILAASERG